MYCKGPVVSVSLMMYRWVPVLTMRTRVVTCGCTKVARGRNCGSSWRKEFCTGSKPARWETLSVALLWCCVICVLWEWLCDGLIISFFLHFYWNETLLTVYIACWTPCSDTWVSYIPNGQKHYFPILSCAQKKTPIDSDVCVCVIL